MKFPALLTATVLALAVSGSAIADPWAPSGSLLFTNPTGMVGPNETVTAQMKFTLDTNSQAIDLTQPYSFDTPSGWESVTSFGVRVGFGCDDTFSGGCDPNGNPYSFDFDISPDGYSKVQNPSLMMNPGDSITFNAFIMTPNVPAVPAGTYYAYYYQVSGYLEGRDANESYVDQSFLIAKTCWGYENCSGDQVFSRTVTAPVPEPETYAMMLAGLGLLGVMTRRRKQKAVA